MTARGRPETILIVEDNPITRKVLRVALQSAGYTAVEAPDGRRALEQAQAHAPALIIQDLRLPDMDGIDLVTRFRAMPEARDIPILAFSGLQSKVEEARSLQSGFTDYLFKPVEPSRLLEIVAEHLRQTRGPTTGVGFGRRILLVDDDPVQLKLQRLNLQGAGFQVFTARDGLEALETARAERPDAIVTDLIMPKLGGLDFCLAVRRDPALARTPIVLSSSTYSDLSPSDRDKAREAGANSFVARTPDSEDMIRHVVEALASGDAPTPTPGIEGIKAVYSEALIQQLERQTELNRRLLRRAAIQTGQLSVLTGISETLSRSRNPDVAINEILARVLDASGTSAGAIFLVESGVRLRLGCHIGIRQGGESLLAQFYGHAELLTRSMMDSKVLLLPSTELGETGDEVVRGAGCGSMIIIPLAAPEGPQGVMIINSDQTGLEERWIESVKVIASQLGQAILLARTLERLTESEQRYRGLFDGVPLGLYRISSTGQFLEANPAMLQLLGYTDVQSLLAARLPDHCVEEADRRRWDSMLTHVEAARNEELRMRRCDGSVIWVRNTTRAIPDEKRAAICYEGSAEDITARREAEDALRRNYNLLHAVIDNTPDAIFVKDLHGRYLMVNAADASLLGRTQAQILGQTDQDLFPPETAREIEEIDRKILEHGATQVSEQDFRIRGQSHTYLSLRGVYRDSEGGPAGVFGIARDITDRKHAEEALAERARLATLVADVGLALTQAESLPQVLQRCTDAAVKHLGGAFARIWTLNEETQTLELQASAGMYTHLDGPHSRVRVGESKIGLIAKERRPHLSNTVGGDPRVSDQEWARREGMVAFAGHPLVVEDKVVGVFAMFSRHPFSEATFQALGAVADEIALGIEHKRAEEALRESEAQFRSLANSSPLGIFLMNAAAQCVYTNPKWQEIAGLSPEETLGEGWLRAVHPDDAAEARARWTDVRQHGTDLDAEQRIRTPKGEVRLTHTRAAAVKDAGGAVVGWVGTVEDITERKALEEQFRQAQKMEAIGQLAGGVAHDFNNLLTAILGYAELMLIDMSASDPRREDAEEIVSAAERAGALTRQLLAFSRQQVLEPRVLNLNEVISQLTRMLRRLLNEDIELVAQLSDELGSVKADVGQVEQVILNLCVNARDAMPGGGKLTIETANAELDSAYVSLHQPVKPGAYVMLAISDTGQGMSAEIQRRIFEPFFTTKGVGKGTGLGLATVYGIVKQSEGYVWVYSEIGRGTTFKIYLPLIDDAPAGMGRAPAERALAPGSETILLVEDEEIVRKLARQVLERQGYHLLVAKNGQEALDMAGRHKGTLNLIITDVVMPGMQGPELAERLKRGHPDCRVLYISGYAPEAVVRHGVLHPGTNFIGKPFTPALFARRVRELLDQPEESAET